MGKSKDEISYNKKRAFYPDKIKRRALLEYAKGKSPDEALRACGYNFDLANSQEKKHTAKLLYKWRQELYANKDLLAHKYEYLDAPDFCAEIEEAGDDDEFDEIYDFFKKLYRKKLREEKNYNGKSTKNEQ